MLAGCAARTPPVVAGPPPAQPIVASRSIPLITNAGLQFRDLNRSGALDPYEDWRLSPAARAEDLVKRMTLAEKAGQLIVPGIGGNAPPGPPGGPKDTAHDPAALDRLVTRQHATHLAIRLGGDATTIAAANNAAQELAERSRLGLPLTISTDSRHSFTALIGASMGGGTFSPWPNAIGFAALGDAETVRRHAALVRRDYRAVGIAMLLGPQIDLATEPRWTRIFETFGENAALSSRLAAAYVEGLQGGRDGLAPGGVAAVIKHFAGYSAPVDGFDAHNRYGRFSRLSDAEFRQHLRPFEGALAARPVGVMPAYSILEGVTFHGAPSEPVGAGFNRAIITGELRQRLGFGGVVLSDFAIIEDCNEICLNGAPAGQPPSWAGVSTAWGVEHLTKPQRVAKALAAGVDQLGGLEDAGPIMQAVEQGLVSAARLDESVRRVVELDIALGLYERPFVDAAQAESTVGGMADRLEGRRVQARSMVLLEADRPLRLAPGTRVLAFGIEAAALRSAGLEPVSDPARAEIAVLRTSSPFERLHPGFIFGSFHQEGSLAFSPDHPALTFIANLPKGLPLIADVRLERPAILTPLNARAQVLLASFGTGDEAFLDVLTGKVAPEGRLPIELPSSMAAVAAQRPGAPADSAAPLYPLGYAAVPR